MTTTSSIQEAYLNDLIEQGKQTFVFLKNGVKLRGKLVAYTAYTLLLEGMDALPVVILKSNISTVCPS